MAKVVIFGNTEFTEVVWWYLQHDSEHEVVAFTVHEKYITEPTFCNLPVVPFENIMDLYPCNQYRMFIGIGYAKRNHLRANLYDTVRNLGYTLISYINSTVVNQAQIAIGDNCFIMENVIIQAFCSIGNDVFIWNSSTISHHSHIGDHCFITHNVAISGHVTVEDYCFIGANATIRDGVTLAESSVVGLGAIILEDTEPNSVYKSETTPKHAYLTEHLSNI